MGIVKHYHQSPYFDTYYNKSEDIKARTAAMPPVGMLKPEAAPEDDCGEAEDVLDEGAPEVELGDDPVVDPPLTVPASLHVIDDGTV